MQLRAARQVVQRCAGQSFPAGGGAVPLAAPAQQRWNSFIKQVMEQVKKDAEADPKLKKDWEKVRNSSQRIAERGATMEERLSSLGENLKSASSRTSEVLSSWREKAQGSASSASSRMNEATEQNEALKKARVFIAARMDAGAAASSAAVGRTKGAFVKVMDTSSKVFDYITDADKKGEKTKKWRQERTVAETMADEAKAAASDAQARASSAEDPAAAAKEATQAPPSHDGGALVVSEARSSSWDRFGAGVRDMPFLRSVFENPLFDRLFGESEIAASIREMKELDYNFHLEDFAEDMEHIVAPHIIKTYLEGDQEALQKHCGEAAFAAVNASIKARKQQKLSLNPEILAGPKELQLVSAKLNEKGPPSFIWTFQMQQVNCLTDSSGEIIEGAIDDIRNVCYAMVVNRHPGIDKEKGLEYPWQVSELAILWNQPCF